MLLQKIKTRGFLGHRGAADGEADGSPDFVELDFTDTSLSLVHGANGAGKSTFWDALLFSFFKEHRASGREAGKKLEHLIHDRADKAEIFVEFLLDDGQTYEIYSEIKRKKGDSANATRRLWRVDGENRETKCENDKAVENWIKQNLQMSAQTFTSSVLLRQGDADKFLKAKPAPRKEILLELLRLDFYRELGTQATKHKNDYKKDSDKLNDELATLSNPTDTEIKDQRDLIKKWKTVIENLNKAEKAKADELRDAQTAQKLIGNISEVEKQQKEDAQFLDAQRAADIRNKYERFCELEKVLVRLEKLWEAKTELEREEKSLGKCETEIGDLEKELQRLTENLAEYVETENSAQAEFSAAETALQKAIAERGAAQKTFEQLTEIEKLETAIADEEVKLAPHNSVLFRREEIQKNFARFQELEKGLALLRTLQTAEEKLQQAEAGWKRLLDEFEDKKRFGNEIQKKVENFNAQLKAKVSEKTTLQTKSNDCRSNLKFWRDKLESRNQATGEIECPVCGTTLDEQAAHRITDELEKAAAEIAALETQEIELKNALEEIEKELTAISDEKEETEKQARKVQDALTKADVNLEHAKSEAKNCRARFTDAQSNAGDWGSKDFTKLESEFSALENAQTEHGQLETALEIEGKVLAVVENLRGQLNVFSSFDESEREKIKQSAEVFGKKVSACETAQNAAGVNLTEAKDAVGNLEKRKIKLETGLESKRGNLADLQTRRDSAAGKVEKCKREIPADHAEFQAAGEEKSKYETLSVEKADLQSVKAEHDKLKTAAGRESDLRGQLTAYQKQLDEIPRVHRRSVSDVENEISKITADVKQTDDELKSSDNRLGEMKNQQIAHQAKKAESDTANKDLRLWQKLAEAFGKKGLEARIVQAAQETVKNNANKILGALCDSFQIKLEESVNGEELEIYVHDSNTQNADEKGRHFEYFSGGESLLIAISLAVAIGQAVTGKNAANTLIVDEGFGALDDTRREFLVEELKRLSDEVLKGGRVIVVSHQDNVKEKFSHRYHLEKDEKGFVKVSLERNL